jgi:hypothetical protein
MGDHMLDKLLEFGSTSDWVTPLVAMIQDGVNGPSHIFMIPDDCGRSGFEIQRLLRDKGIKTWGLMVFDGFIMITVRLAQAYWAQYLLLRERVPIEYGLLDKRDAPAAKKGVRSERMVPAAPPARKGLFAELTRAVDGLVDELEALFGL